MPRAQYNEEHKLDLRPRDSRRTHLDAGATAADAEAVAQTLANAFFDDPLISFLLKDSDSRGVGLPRLLKLLFKLGLPYGRQRLRTHREMTARRRPDRLPNVAPPDPTIDSNARKKK